MQEIRVWSSGWKIPWRMKWQTTPAFLPGKSHGQRNLEGYSPWGHKRVGHDLPIKQQWQFIWKENRSKKVTGCRKKQTKILGCLSSWPKSSRVRELEFNFSYDLRGSHTTCFSELFAWGKKGEAFVHLYFFLIVMVPALLVCMCMNTEMVSMGPTLSSEKPQDRKQEQYQSQLRAKSILVAPVRRGQSWSAGPCGVRDRIKRICSGLWEVHFKGLKMPSFYSSFHCFDGETHVTHRKKTYNFRITGTLSLT